MRIEPRPLPETLPDFDDLPPLLARLCTARDMRCAEELDKDLARLAPFRRLRDIEEGVVLLVEALESGQRTLIIDDFDANGTTTNSVGVLALRILGATQADYLMPNRSEYGYGLAPEIVGMTLGERPDLLVTMDNGISSMDDVRATKAAGLEVLVTDHHLPGPELLAVDAIIDPNRPGCELPSKAMAGVGMISYAMLALRAHLRELDWFARRGLEEPDLAELLDLVALGGVADVVPLDANNRILVHQDLARICAGYARPGLHALLEMAGRPPVRITSTDLGFILGPHLNATGRLNDMSLGTECLLYDDEALARDMTVQLDQLNQDRGAIEQGMQREALAQLRELNLEQPPFGLCLLDADWHQSVIGIFASRLKERYHRPTITFTDAGDGSLEGSAWSIPSFHTRDALDAVAARHSGLISKFDGRAMAAGLSLPQENFGVFSIAFDAEVRRQLTEEDLAGRLLPDDQLSIQEFYLELARALRQAGPWGQHLPEPMFHRVFQLVQQRTVGGRHLRLVLKSECGSLQLDGIAFNVDREQWPSPTVHQAELAYKLDVDKSCDQESVQLMTVHMVPR